MATRKAIAFASGGEGFLPQVGQANEVAMWELTG